MSIEAPRLPAHAPRFSSSFSGQVPVRLDGAPRGILSGMGEWRGVRDFEHATLCRAFNLDPARFWFDLPSSVRGIGSNSTGSRGSRVINGFVMCGREPTPVGKLTILQNDRTGLRDDDPMNERDFFDLSRT